MRYIQCKAHTITVIRLASLFEGVNVAYKSNE